MTRPTVTAAVAGEHAVRTAFEVFLTSAASIRTSSTEVPQQWEVFIEARRDDWRLTETSPELIEAGWREHRQRLVGQSRNAAREHLAHYGERLSALVDENVRRSVSDMLTELSSPHGVAWSEIAALLGISVPALRKWRKNLSGTTAENHKRLAQLTAFYSVLSELVERPARWMAIPLVDGFNVTPSDLYSSDNAARLLDLAAGNAGTTAEGVLDEIAGGWRDRWRSEYEIVEGADGLPSMRPRQIGG